MYKLTKNLPSVSEEHNRKEKRILKTMIGLPIEIRL